MAYQYYHVILFVLILLISLSRAKTSLRPKALLVPVTKDASTLQYVYHNQTKNPLVPISLTLDLGGQFLWVQCDNNYISSTCRPARCSSAQCSLAKARSCVRECDSILYPGCNKNTYGLLPSNSVDLYATFAEVGSDVVTIQSTNGKKLSIFVLVSQLLFVCGSEYLLDYLARGVRGMAGLGRARISLPAFSVPSCF